MMFLSRVFVSLLGVSAIWVIYDVLANNKNLSNSMKLFWIILAVLFSIITAIAYYLIGRNAKAKRDLPEQKLIYADKIVRG